MDVLSKLLDTAVLSNRFSLHRSCKDPLISHLSFADDLLIFFNGTSDSLRGILRVLDQFYAMSGLRMNCQKTVLFLDGHNHQALTTMADEFGLSKGVLPVRYLGIPLSPLALKPCDYQVLLDGIQQRLLSWKVRHLSYGGRLQLIRSVLSSMTNFWLSIFILPKQCIQKVEGLCRSFLWNGDNSSSKGAKVSWDDVCKPKKAGGLGLRRLILWNQVLGLKLIWMLLTKGGSLWVAWVRKNLIRNGGLWTSQYTNKGSSQWKKLIKLKSLAGQFLSCKIGSGSTISFWFDRWLPQGSLISLVGHQGPRITGISAEASIKDVILRNQWLTTSASRNPTISTLRQLLPPPPILSDAAHDQFYWKSSATNSNQLFSSKLTWNLLQPSLPQVTWFNVVWIKLGIPKHIFIFWLAVLGRLVTKDKLISWGISVPSVCLLCNVHDESLDHILVHCSFVQAIWTAFLFPFPGMRYQNFRSIVDWASARSVEQSLTIIERLLIQAIVYEIWTERNGRMHARSSTDQRGIINKISGIIRSKLSSISSTQTSHISNTTLLEVWFNRYQAQIQANSVQGPPLIQASS